jgi:hypothetical protein
MTIFYLCLITIVVCIVDAILNHKKSREKIETTCIEESHAKTFTDNLISNLILAAPLIITLFIVHTIVSLFGG